MSNILISKFQKTKANPLKFYSIRKNFMMIYHHEQYTIKKQQSPYSLSLSQFIQNDNLRYLLYTQFINPLFNNKK